MVEYQQWYYGREISEDFFERTCVRYTADHFDIADLTKQQESPDGTFAILDDILQMQFFDSNGDTNQLSGFISFVYNGYHVLIVKDKEVYTGIKETYDSSEDPEIIRRLTNTKTYMDAIKELMDPANANTKPE